MTTSLPRVSKPSYAPYICNLHLKKTNHIIITTFISTWVDFHPIPRLTALFRDFVGTLLGGDEQQGTTSLVQSMVVL